MFQSKTKSQSNNANSALNSLVSGTHLTGDITSKNDFRIDGTLNGNMKCEGKVIIGGGGKVEGNVQCCDCVIEGVFKGEMDVQHSLSVQAEAQVSGIVKTEKLIIQAGAIFNVRCTMGEHTFGKEEKVKVKEEKKHVTQ